MISELLGQRVRGLTLHVGQALARLGLSANLLTVLGLILNGVVAIVIATGHNVAGGVLLLFASAFDMLDGAVARATDEASPFGGFLDATLDRYSESVVYLGVLLLFLKTPDPNLGVILTFLATVGSLLISYARARAESFGYRASVGLVARPERVVILAVGLITGHLLAAMAILAITTHLTAATRILHVWRASRDAGVVAVPNVATTPAPRADAR